LAVPLMRELEGKTDTSSDPWNPSDTRGSSLRTRPIPALRLGWNAVDDSQYRRPWPLSTYGHTPE
jgi:hypothetical protein